MNAEEYPKMRELEDRYWWFVSRRRMALSWLDESAPAGRVLDLGSGTGALLQSLQPERDAWGVDFSPLALELAKERGLKNLHLGDAQDLPFPPDAFDAVVSLDTLEHVPDDRLALKEIHRVLRPGGVVILNVPAYSWLWGPHDTALHHFRRYSREELREKVEEAGFSIERLSSGVFFLFPVVVLVRLKDKLRMMVTKEEARVALPQVPEWANSFLVRMMDAESSLMTRFSLPWGSSLCLLARRKD
jgi:SAM-dependent methyltransferase